MKFYQTDSFKIGGTALVTAALFWISSSISFNGNNFAISGSGRISMGRSDSLKGDWYKNAIIHTDSAGHRVLHYQLKST